MCDKEAAEAATAGFEWAAEFLARERIFVSRDIPYRTQLVPLAALRAVLGEAIDRHANAVKVRQWYWSDVLDLVGELNEQSGKTIVLVLHDLNQACRYAHHLIALEDGEVWARGNPADVITAELVESVFGLRVAVVPDPVEGTPMCVPIGRVGRRMADVGEAGSPARSGPPQPDPGTPGQDGDRAAQPPAGTSEDAA